MRQSYDNLRQPHMSGLTFDEPVLASGTKKELPIAKKMKLEYD